MPKTAQTASPNDHALDRFLAQKAAIDAALKRIQDSSEAHFNVDLAEVTRTDAANAATLAEQLQQIADRLFIERFPLESAHKGRVYIRTGRLAQRFADNSLVAEYECHYVAGGERCEDRLWRGLDGSIMPG